MDGDINFRYANPLSICSVPPMNAGDDSEISIRYPDKPELVWDNLLASPIVLEAVP